MNQEKIRRKITLHHYQKTSENNILPPYMEQYTPKTDAEWANYILALGSIPSAQPKLHRLLQYTKGPFLRRMLLIALRKNQGALNSEEHAVVDALPLSEDIAAYKQYLKGSIQVRESFDQCSDENLLFRYMIKAALYFIDLPLIKELYNLLEAGDIYVDSPTRLWIYRRIFRFLKGISHDPELYLNLALFFLEEHQESYVARRLYEHRAIVEYDTKNNLDLNIGAQPNPKAVALHGGAIWWEHNFAAIAKHNHLPIRKAAVQYAKSRDDVSWQQVREWTTRKTPEWCSFAIHFFLQQPESIQKNLFPALASTLPVFLNDTPSAEDSAAIQALLVKEPQLLHIQANDFIIPRFAISHQNDELKKLLENIISDISSNTLLDFFWQTFTDQVQEGDPNSISLFPTILKKSFALNNDRYFSYLHQFIAHHNLPDKIQPALALIPLKYWTQKWCAQWLFHPNTLGSYVQNVVQRQEEEQLITKAQHLETALYGIAKASDSTETGTFNIHISPKDYQPKKRWQGYPDLDGGLLPQNEKTVQTIVREDSDDNSETFNLAFPFPYDGQTYQTACVDSNGWLFFGGHKGSTYSNDSIFNQSRKEPLLFPWWADLRTARNEGYIKTWTTTNKSKNTQVIEWKVYEEYSQSTSQHVLLTFQICLYEDGAFSFRYGPSLNVGNHSSYRAAACGFSGPSFGARACIRPNVNLDWRKDYPGTPQINQALVDEQKKSQQAYLVPFTSVPAHQLSAQTLFDLINIDNQYVQSQIHELLIAHPLPTANLPGGFFQTLYEHANPQIRLKALDACLRYQGENPSLHWPLLYEAYVSEKKNRSSTYSLLEKTCVKKLLQKALKQANIALSDVEDLLQEQAGYITDKRLDAEMIPSIILEVVQGRIDCGEEVTKQTLDWIQTHIGYTPQAQNELNLLLEKYQGTLRSMLRQSVISALQSQEECCIDFVEQCCKKEDYFNEILTESIPNLSHSYWIENPKIWKELFVALPNNPHLLQAYNSIAKDSLQKGVDLYLSLISEPFAPLLMSNLAFIIENKEKTGSWWHDYITHEDLSISSLLMVLFGNLAQDAPREAENLLLDWISRCSPNMTQYALLYSLTMMKPFSSSLRIAVSMLVHSDPIFQARGRLYLESSTERPQKILHTFLNRLRFSEPNPGYHQAIVREINIRFPNASTLVHASMLWRLMHSKTAEAQNIAITYLKQRPATELTISKLYTLSQNSLHEARQLAWDKLQDKRSEMLSHIEDCYQLLEGRWDDTREFGITFFQSVPQERWSIPLLIRLYDSNRADIQSLGKELITKYVSADSQQELLEKIIQHPAQELEAFISGELFKQDQQTISVLFSKLIPLFKTILGRVHGNRNTKNKLLSFMHQKARENSDHAQEVLPVLHWLSASQVRTDRDVAIQMILDIQLLHPQLKQALPIISPRAHKTRQ